MILNTHHGHVKHTHIVRKNHPQDETEPMTYIYENADGHLYLYCHRCGYTASVPQFADVVFPY